MPDDGRRLAVTIDEGARPTVLWLGGFRSSMTATKAEALAAWGREHGRRVVRFDYSGHGASEGNFSGGRISRWLGEAKAVLAAHSAGEVVIAASSMGAWIACLLTRGAAVPGLKGLVLLAPAADFTDKLLLPALSEAQRVELSAAGTVTIPDDYGYGTFHLSRDFFDDGRRLNVLDAPLRVGAPVHILQGMADRTVPHEHAEKLVSRLVEDDVVLTLIKDGDHRLSRPQDIARMLDAIERIAPAG
jgi:pimeloyl-ACP methyl ester carboxylesterase